MHKVIYDLTKIKYKKRQFSTQHCENLKASIKKGYRNGRVVWNKGMKGLHLSPKSEFKKGRDSSGEKHSQWKGGRKTSSMGYILIHSPDHPYRGKHKYVMEHRLVMEQYLKRYLKPSEKVHHKNGIRNDNRIENLEIVATQPHYGKVKCPFCNKEFLIQ